MLINFRCENFLSIDDMETFSMVAGRTKRHIEHVVNFSESKDLLRFSAIYGANAAGKSSFIKAILYAQHFIINGLDDKLLFMDSYNKNDLSNRHKETKFDFEFIINDKVYSYGFSILLSERKFVQEWLYDITNDEELIFWVDRTSNDSDINFSYLEVTPEVSSRLEIYIEDNRHDNNQLFLTALKDGKRTLAYQDGIGIFTKIFQWFEEKLEVLGPGDEAKGSIPSISFEGDKYKIDLGEYLDRNDTGVIGVETVSISSMTGVPAKIQNRLIEAINQRALEKKDSEKTVISSILKTGTHIFILKWNGESVDLSELKFKHRNDTLYSLHEESDGTVRLIELFSVLYNAHDKVFVIDEIDRSLHPLLTYNFIESFLKKQCHSQLVVTTHEDLLLDFDLLRRDEIWFTEKDKDGNSSLYSLEEFKERFDRVISNAYLDGRYGGIPKLKNLFSILDEKIEG